MRSAFLLLASIGLVVGCSATNDTSLFGTGGEGGGTGGGGNGGGGGGAGGGSSSTGIDITVGSGGGGVGGGAGGGNLVAEVYGHSPNALYKLDPTTKQVTELGNFQGCSGVIDIALDKDSNLYGTAGGGFYKIDKDTAVCTLIASGGYPNSLSFVPKGTVDPNVEALVGYNGNAYIRIDTTTGGITSLGGTLPSGYFSSGDIVSVINGPTYLTVVGGGCGDCIVEIDPTTGTMIKNWGPLGYGAVYGLAFWAGAAYGFTDGGDLFEVKFANGAVTTTDIAIPGAPMNLQFWGAGSTTSAPPVPIPE
jgi:hypothetical protein